jgi:hypothetical protein
MPDKNKLKVLAEQGVRIVPTCGTCTHGKFFGRPWGECSLRTYQHEKHTGLRQMPAHLSFTCPSYGSGSANLQELGEYATLIPTKD